MKKFLSIFMCAILIVALFVVPLSASATEDTITLKSGTYKFNNDLVVPEQVIEQEINFTSNNWSFIGFSIINSDTLQLIYLAENIEEETPVFIGSEGGWLGSYYGTDNEQLQTVTFSKDTSVSYIFGQWFIASTDYITVNSKCDGSTCPATDTNEDNICDDCGLPFTFALRNDTYNFNGVYMPTTVELQDGSTSTVKDVWSIVKQTGGNIILMSDGDFENSTLRTVSSDVVYDNGQVVITGLTIVTNYEATYMDDGTPYWKFAATETWKTDGASVGNENQILWVAADIKDRQGLLVKLNGDVNFRTPLWEEMGQVTQGAIPNFLTTTGGNLMTLTLCGVGLLTLLVVLVLLLKTLRKSLNQ